MLCCKNQRKNQKPELVPHPDGGWGWFVCFAAFTTQFIVLGTMNNFGIIYVALLKEFPGTSTSSAAWVGSITYGMMFILGPLATTLCTKLNCRVTTMIGCTIAGAGCLLGSFSTKMWQMNLTYGFLFGIGASMCYFPSVVILGQYFWKRLSLANGITSSGSGVGTLAMGPILQNLLEHFGLRNTMRISAGMIICVWVCSFVYRPINTGFLNNTSESDEKDDKKKQRFAALQIFKNKAYILWCVALSFWMLGYFVPFVHLVRLALDLGIDMDRSTLLIGLMSIGSTAGRLIFGKIADHPKVNRLYLYQLSFLVMGICNTVCPVLTNYIGLAAYSFIWGFFEGCYVLLAPVLTGDIVGRDKMAAGVGILFGIKSVPLTLGPPLAGFIYDVSGSYQVAFYIAGAVPTLAACLMFGIPFLMPENICNSRVSEKEVVEPGNDDDCVKFDYREQLSKKGENDSDDQDVVRFDWRKYENQAQPQWQSLAPIPEVTVDTDTTSNDPKENSNFSCTSLTSQLRPKSMVVSSTSLKFDNPWQVRATSNGHLSTTTPVRETCLVTVDSTSHTQIAELQNTLSASVFSLVKKYMDMPRMVSASECGGSMGCIPTHIAADPSNKPPGTKNNMVGKETVV